MAKANIKILLLFFLVKASTLWSQDNLLYSSLLIPQELKQNANDVIRLENKTLEIKSSKEAYLYHRQVISILNEDSKQNVFYVPYDKQSKVKKIRARIFDADGDLIRKIKEDEIEDVSSVSSFSIYEDDRLKYLKVNHNSFPYTVEFEYELSVKGMLMCFLPDWNIQAYNSSIQKAKYQIKIPEELKLHHKALNLEVKPAVKTDQGITTYQWMIENLNAKSSEMFSPSPSFVLPRLLVALDQFEIDNYEGSFRSWKDFGHFMHQLWDGRDQLSESTQQELLALTANASSNTEKIEILYRYLQKNMRYVSVQLGIGGWQPFDAAYVEKNKFGDCKALTNFMKAMLKAVDIPAFPVLIYSSRNPDYMVSEDFTNAKFNHVILNVPSENIWLECTSKDYPMNYIGRSNADRNALMIAENEAKLVKTPAYESEENIERNTIQIHLDEQGSAKMEGHCQLKGTLHEAYRYMSFNYGQEDFEKWFRQNSDLPSFSIEKLNYTAAEHTPEFELHTDLVVKNYASKGGKRLFVPINKINPFGANLKTYKNRKYPVVIRDGYTEEDVFVFHLPKGYELESAPKAETKIESPFGTYTLQVEKSENSICFKRRFTLNPTHQPADQYTALRDFFKAVAKCDASKMVLVQK